MAHKRKDTLTKTTEWAKHLRPYHKRKAAKAERRACKKEISNRQFVETTIREFVSEICKYVNN